MNYSVSAIILAGGLSRRFIGNKSLAMLLGKPMITYVVNAVEPLVDEILVITNSEDNRKEISKILSSSVKLFLDEYNLKSPVVGALTGLKHAKGMISLILACDAPLLSPKVVSFILESAKGYDAVIPKWPNGYIEPLQAVYNTEKTLQAYLEAITMEDLRMQDIITRLRKVLFLSTNILLELDPMLYTFLNVNTLKDLRRIEKILKYKKYVNKN